MSFGQHGSRETPAAAELYARAPAFAEGPSWRPGDDSVLFCSRGLRRITRDRRVVPFLPTLRPAGTVLLGDGRLLVCDNRYRALLLVARDGQRVDVLAERWQNRPLRVLNDLSVDRAGSIYWTDPGRFDPKRPDGAVFRLTPSGRVDRVADGLAFPNGIEVDPAGRHLYVVESTANRILRFAVPAPDAPRLGPPTVFFRFRTFGDGCAFDASGNLWAAEFMGREVVAIDPRGRRLWGMTVPAGAVSNLTFGGAGRRTLFVTTGTPDAVFRVPAGVAGFAGHPGAARYRVVRSLKLRAAGSP
jgi:gluconolactonase